MISGLARSRVRDELGWVADVLVHVEPQSTRSSAPDTDRYLNDRRLTPDRI